MAQTIFPDQVLPFLVSQTRAALRASETIPVEAAAAAWFFLLEAAPVYSGAYRAALRVGLNELPEIPDDLRNIEDSFRHELHSGGRIYSPQVAPGEVYAELSDYEIDDDIIIGNEIRYAQLVEEKEGMLITERARQVAEAELFRRIAEFNRRSIAATGGRRPRPRGRRG